MKIRGSIANLNIFSEEISEMRYWYLWSRTSAKFYFFDVGVGNALLKRKEIASETPELGKNLEQLIFLELNAFKDLELFYWRSTSKFEVDFVIEFAGKIWGIEVKAKKIHPQKIIKDYWPLVKSSLSLKKSVSVCALPSYHSRRCHYLLG